MRNNRFREKGDVAEFYHTENFSVSVEFGSILFYIRLSKTRAAVCDTYIRMEEKMAKLGFIWYGKYGVCDAEGSAAYHGTAGDFVFRRRCRESGKNL